MEEKYTTLRKLVEQAMQRSMMSPADFNYLSLRLFDTLHVHISPTTLKRFWGYLPEGGNMVPRMSTLDVLSKMVGFQSWRDYLERTQNGVSAESGFATTSVLYVQGLRVGTEILLTWAPNRKVQIRYEGENLFTIISSVNSKLSVGDTFITSCLAQGEPLYMHTLVHQGGLPTGYVCGKNCGISFTILDSLKKVRDAEGTSNVN